VAGVVTGELAKTSTTMGKAWRFAGWALSFLIFAVHIWYERRKRSRASVPAALHVAVAVAIGAFVLAIVGPVRSHWGAPDFTRVALLSLLLWPIVTGVPAFLVASIVGFASDRMAS
jgi:hypothetical protein